MATKVYYENLNNKVKTHYLFVNYILDIDNTHGPKIDVWVLGVL